ncbi:nitrite reductase small subunit NirD [Roseicella aerolata]|uniref:Nitrite reductase small subunit NirD n=1 Tax=Roseicella aerolata TaxID=2883479 RepID=A0A9X1IH48_9PROT|nr:nitrite reductase small subunit NirD [Roseicella aerolata]MCB4824372.1 nitrite reductase small subunit NirD [Roseicella aerolata]
MDGMVLTSGWAEIGRLTDIPRQGARVVASSIGDIAVFRALDDTVFAIEDRCPHKGGPLSQGIVHGHAVTCPLHNWVIDLQSGEAAAPDVGCVKRIPVKVEDGRVLLSLPGAAA